LDADPPAQGVKIARRITICVAYIRRGRATPQSAPEQQDQNDDQQDQPEATAVIMVWRAEIDAAPPENENKKTQELRSAPSFYSYGTPRTMPADNLL